MKFRSLWITVFCLIISCFTSWAIQADTAAPGGLLNNQMAIINHNGANLVTAATPPALIPPPPRIEAKGFVLMDANSGQILAQENMDEKMPPASLTKLMTVYVTEQNLHMGKIKMNDSIRISENAWRTGGSRMFLKLGTQVSVKDILNGIIVASGNDACVAMAEFIAGSEDSFTSLMNQTAQHLGMMNTHYTDANGLPHPQHYSSPHDLGILARALLTNFPQYYSLFGQKWVYWNNIKQPNRNRLLWRDPTVDGLKTGHTAEAGYCLVSSARRNNMRLISVVMGAPSDTERANESQALLNWGFRFFETHKLFSGNQSLVKARVWSGQNETVPMGLNSDFYATVPAGSYSQLKASLNVNPKIVAPVQKGQSYGTVVVTLNDKTVAEAPLIALEDDAKGGAWSRISDRVAYFFHNWFSNSKTPSSSN